MWDPNKLRGRGGGGGGGRRKKIEKLISVPSPFIRYLRVILLQRLTEDTNIANIALAFFAKMSLFVEYLENAMITSSRSVFLLRLHDFCSRIS